MTYPSDQRTRSGEELNLWGSIYRAFCRIDPWLEPAIFTVSANSAMANEVDVSCQSKNDHGNEFSLTFTQEPASISHLWHLLTSFRRPLTIQEDNVLSFFNAIDTYVGQSPFVFLVRTQDLSHQYFLLRFNRRAWEKYAAAPQCAIRQDQDETSLLYALAAVSFNSYTQSHLELPPELLLTEQELLLRAASRVARAHAKEIGVYSWDHLITNVNEHSLLGYERRSLGGCLVITPKSALQLTLEFLNPISFGVYRLARKALEISSREFPVVSDGNELFGMVPREELVAGNFSEIQFLGRHRWKWSYGERVIFEMQDGIPLLRASGAVRADLANALARWRHVTATDRLLDIVDAVALSNHGALIIISRDAQQEAVRLGMESICFEPNTPSVDAISALTAIDGAVLLDLEARVHSAGIIVDGPACPLGDAARGSRYNSAMRYVAGQRGRAMAIVFSSDGTIDIIDPFMVHALLQQAKGLP
jgi:hypothetical protein